MQFTFFLHYIHLSCWIQVWLNWSKSCGANGPTHLNLMIWHLHRHWYLFGKLKKSVNINITLLILCIYYISKWIWPFWLFWAIIASLTSRFDINTNFDASKQNQMIWLSVDCCCCVLYCPKHFRREKVWLIRFFFHRRTGMTSGFIALSTCTSIKFFQNFMEADFA